MWGLEFYNSRWHPVDEVGYSKNCFLPEMFRDISGEHKRLSNL